MAGTEPTLPELLRFTCTDGRVIDIPEEIGIDYICFGLLLLEDHTTSRLKNLEHKYQRDPKQINIAILQEWLNGRGNQPVTWATLVEVLRDIELHALAYEIEAVKCSARPGLPSYSAGVAPPPGVLQSSGYQYPLPHGGVQVSGIGGHQLPFTLPQLVHQGTKPTLPELMRLTRTDGRLINIPEEIATKYASFGVLLLNDSTGSRVQMITRKHHYDAEQINIAILKEWLTGRGKQPVTWATLVEVLRDIELHALAYEIEAVKCSAGDLLSTGPGTHGGDGSVGDGLESLESVDGTTVLDEDDLMDVRSAVADLAGRWKDLGISLGVRAGDLDTIQSNSFHSPNECLRKMLCLWLRQSYNVERFGKPTWRRLVEAVLDPVGTNNLALAQKIAQEHPSLSLLSLDVNVNSPFQSTTSTGEQSTRIQGDRPEMQQLERFVGVKGMVFEVVKEVSTDWEKLALALHLRGEIIREQRHFQPEAACHTILQRWLNGEGRQPVTWDTLLDCLEDIDHGTLAGYLRKEVVPAKDDSADTALYAGLQRALKPHTVKAKPTGIPLGSGTYGRVIELSSAGEIVAGKVFKISSDIDQQTLTNKWLRELCLMAQVHHPNIVKCKGVCFLGNETMPFLLMERMTSSLHAYLLKPTNLSTALERKLSILHDIASGLNYLHSHKPAIIHRDLTGNNVLLDSELRAKISDFGNARLMDLDPEATPGIYTAMPGTPDYMPPEAQGDSAKCGPSLDVFSFGHLSLFTINQSLVHSLLPSTYIDAGKLCARSEVKRRRQHLDKAEELLKGNPSVLVLIKQCLHNDPAQRPPTAELETRLQDLLRNVNSQTQSTTSTGEQSTTTQGDIMLSEKDLHILTEILRPATPQWKRVGLVLGFLDYELTTIERKPLLIPEGSPGFFREMLSQWLKWAPPNHPSPTIENLAPALQSSEHEDLAIMLRPEYFQRKAVQESHQQIHQRQ